MSGLADKAENMAKGELDKKSQPGNSVERGADNTANSDINNAADQAGVPQQDDKMVDRAADFKINEDIPLGNN